MLILGKEITKRENEAVLQAYSFGMKFNNSGINRTSKSKHESDIRNRNKDSAYNLQISNLSPPPIYCSS